LYQVEYAMEAISHAGICVGILAKDGIVLAVEKKITSKLLENTNSEKMYKVDDHLACSVAGITADANILINYARLCAQRYTLTYQVCRPTALDIDAHYIDEHLLVLVQKLPSLVSVCIQNLPGSVDEKRTRERGESGLLQLYEGVSIRTAAGAPIRVAGSPLWSVGTEYICIPNSKS